MAVYLLLNDMSSVQVQEVTLEGRPSVREVHLQDGGFGPAQEAGVQVIMMGHTTLNVFTTTQIYKYTNTHKYRNTQRKEMSNYSQCNVSQFASHFNVNTAYCSEPNPIVGGCIPRVTYEGSHPG